MLPLGVLLLEILITYS